MTHSNMQRILASLTNARQDHYRHTEAMRRITSLRAQLCDVLDTDRDGLPPEVADAIASMMEWATAEHERAGERVSRWSAEWAAALDTLRTEGITSEHAQQ
jgi:hypothetical protein